MMAMMVSRGARRAVARDRALPRAVPRPAQRACSRPVTRARGQEKRDKAKLVGADRNRARARWPFASGGRSRARRRREKNRSATERRAQCRAFHGHAVIALCLATSGLGTQMGAQRMVDARRAAPDPARCVMCCLAAFAQLPSHCAGWERTMARTSTKHRRAHSPGGAKVSRNNFPCADALLRASCVVAKRFAMVMMNVVIIANHVVN